MNDLMVIEIFLSFFNAHKFGKKLDFLKKKN